MAKLGEVVCNGLKFAKLPGSKCVPQAVRYSQQSLLLSFQTPPKLSHYPKSTF